MSSRRNARLRREYLYRKSLEGKERELYERKQRLKTALAEGKPIPSDLRHDIEDLKAAVDAEDTRTAKPKTHIDDEYASVGIRDPKICLTTSRDPSSRLKQFTVEMKLVFPNSQRINRGNTTIKEIVDAAREADFTDIVVLQETRGEPDAMIISHLPFGPTVSFSLSGTVLRHDIEGAGTVSEAYPHLIFNNFKTAVGTRVMTVLKSLFPVPKPDAKRVISFSNESDFISFRHHTFEKSAGAGDEPTKKDIVLHEVGPRCELHPFQIRLGTVDQTEAEVEWVLRPYMNTARKHDAL